VSIPSSVGRYRIDRVLGSGAFASVWLGHDDALAAQVAIKVLSGSLIDDLDIRNRFLEEARILRRADSERLVRVHDIGELPDSRPYFVMSYADRGSLADRLQQRPIPVGEALYLAEEIAHGVEVINRLGVIHRDLKPSNILFQSGPDGGERLLIADLGLAKALAHASGAFTLPVGTPGYMSPEQARFGGGLDVRADVYGIGALAYHLLTGRAPGPAPVRVPPSGIQPGLPPQIDQLIMRAMEADRDDRWPTAEAFAEAIAKLRHDMPTPVSGMPVVPPPDQQQQPSAQQQAASTQLPPPGPPPGPPPQMPRRPPPAGPPGPPGPVPAPPPGRWTDAEDDSATAEIRVPPSADPNRTSVDQDVDEEPTVSERPGATAVFPTMPPRQEPREEPIEALLPPVGGAGSPDQNTVQDQPKPAKPGGGGPSQDRSTKRLLIPAGIAAGILLIAIGASLLLGNLFGGDDDGKPNPSAPPAGFSKVSESKGRLSMTVPTGWAKQQEETWSPSSVGLAADTQRQPVLRATPNLAQFRALKTATPGVFVGMTRDLTPGRLPPPNVSQHPGCTRQQPQPYERGTLKGTITRWVRCDGGPISFSEIGLTDSAGKFGLWIRVKQIDNNDLTKQILDSLQTKAP
jgi:serine/threonine protein kinase